MRPVSPVTGGATSSYGEGRVHLLRPSLHRAGKSQTPPTPARPDCCDPHRRHPGGFDAIAATLPLCSVGYEPQLNAKGERLIWLEAAVADCLMAMRGPAESYSDVILRLVELDAGQRA